MFSISQKPSYFWPVVVNLPTDGGQVSKQTFDAEFKRITQSRVEEMRSLVEKNEMTDIDLVKEVMIGWKGVTDNDVEVVFSDTNLDLVLQIPSVAGAIVVAFLESLTGIKRKN